MKAQIKWIGDFFSRLVQPIFQDPFEKDENKLFRTEILLDEFMFRTKPYLLNRYSLYQLSDESGIPIADLTSIIDRRRNIGFKDFIDEYRIGYCKQLLERIPPKTISLFDLSVICGFTDQQDFCTAFKKATHISVTEYVRKVYRGRLSTNALGSTRAFVFLLLTIASLHIIKANNQPQQSARATKKIVETGVLLHPETLSPGVPKKSEPSP